jgi:DNA repair protein RAD16
MSNKKKIEKSMKECESLSSTPTPNSDKGESSSYSTPETSAVVTPADQPKTLVTKRGRRSTAIKSDIPTLAVNAVLRNSEFSLHAGSTKRKRIVDSEEEDGGEEEEDDDDDTPDAQLARALQEQEDVHTGASLMSNIKSDQDGIIPQGRTLRKARKTFPKTEFTSDFVDSDENEASTVSKRFKVELNNSGTNSVEFRAKKKPRVLMDSDDSEEFMEIDDSTGESEVPIPMSTPRSRAAKMLMPNTPIRNGLPLKRRNRSSRHSAATNLKGSISKSYKRDTKALTSSALLSHDSSHTDDDFDDIRSDSDSMGSEISFEDDTLHPTVTAPRLTQRGARQRINLLEDGTSRRSKMERFRLEKHHPELKTMWQDLENLPKIGNVRIEQPENINRELKPFQLEGVAWMRAMEKTDWGGGLLGDEMGMGKTIQAVSLIMSDWPAKQPSLVLIPPVALMQWQQEIAAYTDGTLRTFVYHGTNAQTKGVSLKDLSKYDVILMSYNSLESMYRKQEKGFKRKNGIYKEKSIIHEIKFHRVILDEAHNIKVCQGCLFF